MRFEAHGGCSGRRRRSILNFSKIFLMFCASVASAQEENSIRTGITWSDNIEKANFNEIEDTIALIDLLLALEHDSRVVDLSLKGAIGFRHFVDGTYDDEVVSDLVGTAGFGVIPDHLTWIAEGRLETVMLDPYRPDVPLNRDNLTVFATGPDLTLPLTGSTAFDVGARYRTNNFDESNADNDVYTGLASLVQKLSASSELSLNYSMENVEYVDESSYTDFDRQRAYIGFLREHPRGSISLDLGGNRLEIEDESYDGFYGALRVERFVSSRTKLHALYQQSYSDTSDDTFLQYQGAGIDPGSNVTEVVVSGDPFEGRRFGIGIDQSRNSSSWYIGANYNRNDYISDSTLDRDWYSLRTTLSHSLGAGWRVELAAGFRRGELAESDRVDDDVDVQLGLARYLSRVVDVKLGYAFARRSSNDSTQNYRENRVSLTIGYSPRSE